MLSVVAVCLLGILGAGCEAGSAARTPGSPSASRPRPTSTSPSASTSPPTVPGASGDYAAAVRVALKYHLRVWLETDLVKRWLAGPSSFNAALGQIGSLAQIPGVVGIKIADEMGYRDGLTTPEQIKAFLAAAGAGLNRVAPGKPLLADMIVPEMGCLPGQSPPLLWSTECTAETRGQYPQLSIAAVTSYLQMRVLSVLDLSTGLLSDASYAGWGADRNIAQNAAWAAARQAGWASLVTLQARKALAHPGGYAESAAATAADMRAWVDLPLADGAGAVDIWTWRQLYQGSINRILDPGLQPNALWEALRARRAKGDVLFTHLSPHSLEVNLDTDVALLAQVFSAVFVAAGTG